MVNFPMSGEFQAHVCIKKIHSLEFEINITKLCWVSTRAFALELRFCIDVPVIHDCIKINRCSVNLINCRSKLCFDYTNWGLFQCEPVPELHKLEVEFVGRKGWIDFSIHKKSLII